MSDPNLPPPGDPDQWGQPPASQQPQWGEQPTQQWGQPAQQPAQQWAQQPAMPYQPAAGGANPYDSDSTVVLVTGILSLVVCGLIGIFAWVRGNSVRSTAEAAGWPEPSTNKVGRILGIVGTIIGVAQVGFGILWLILFFGVAASSSVS